jgi:branched-chain amino acid transport system substrate-binding protein
MRTRRVRILTLATVGLLVLTACGSSSKKSTAAATGGSTSASGPDASHPIVIGLDCDTSGPGASYATPSCKATKDTIDLINSKGGVLGRKLTYVEGNDESDPTKTPTVIQKLVSQGAQALFLITSSAGALQAKSLIQRTGIPVIMSVASNPLVTQAPDNDFLYELAETTANWAEELCGAFQKKNIKTLGFLQDDSASEVAFNKGFLSALTCVKADVQTAPIAATDLSAAVARLKADKNDAVMVGTSSINFEVLAQNTLHQQMDSVPRFTEATLGGVPAAWKQAQSGALNGLVGFSGITDKNTNTTAAKEYFASKEGSDFVMTQFWAQAYDGVQLLSQAITKAGKTDGKAVNDALQTLSGYKASFGYPGFTLSFSPTKHLGADGLCGEVLVQWGADNQLSGPWADYQPNCSN